MNKLAFIFLTAFFAFASLATQAGVAPVKLGGVANSSFTDKMPDDKQGGWTDQGGQDLKVLKSGKLDISGISFDILSDQETGGKSCIVIAGGPARPYFPATAEVPVDGTGSEKFFYLLNAGAWCQANNEILAIINFKYDDGTVEEKHIRGGRDTMDWCQPASAPNAARVWSEYNGNTQVSLFLSKFPLKTSARLKSVEFSASNVVWMVVGAAIGDEVKIVPMKSNFNVTKTVKAPETPSPMVNVKADKPPRNIILVIGDGMGQGAYDLASICTHGETNRLFMQQLPIAGFCETYSNNSKVTDSAASGTAIACGMKVNNSNIGVTAEGKRLKSVAESAHELGKSIAMITSDSLSGATPAVFYAHQTQRGMASDILVDASTCGFDVLVGNAGTRGLFVQNGSEPTQRNLQKEMEANGYQFVSTPDEFASVSAQKKVVGQIDDKFWKSSETVIGELTETAMKRLEANPKGFFMMVESSLPDKGGHGNDPNLTLLGTIQADWIAKAAVDYAAKHPDTLVIVTADHETGTLTAEKATPDNSGPLIQYGGISHSGAPVPIHAYGPMAELFGGKINNIDIAKNIATFWGFEAPIVTEP